MTDNSDKVFEQEAAVFKALGHPTRLRIVKALAGGEKCVCELQSLTGGSLPTPSGAPHGRGDRKPQGGAQHLLLARTSMHRHHARVP